MKIKNIILQIAALGLMATVAEGAVFRFHASGDWLDISNNGSGPEGWGPNPNNSGALGSLPGGGDDARINWGGNTVTVSSTVPTVGRVQIGVDENGSVEVLSGGVLASNGHFFVGNNNVDVTNANLFVPNGGTVNVGNILYSSNNSSTGNITIDAGGVVNVANHLWLGATSASIISIGGTLTQTGGILGLGTTNASDPSGGSASLNILSGGLLELNNISGTAGTSSIQSGSVIDIQGTGLLTLPGDFVGSVNDYIAANKITGNGTNGAVSVVFDSNSNETIVTAIPEPSSALLLGLVGALGFIRRKRYGPSGSIFNPYGDDGLPHAGFLSFVPSLGTLRDTNLSRIINTIMGRFASLILVLLSGAIPLEAGNYFQDFTGHSSGDTNLGDGSEIGSNNGVAQVRGSGDPYFRLTSNSR